MNIIDVVDVHKVYRLGSIEIYALRGVSFSVKKGEFLCIMGPSGSGKTTLLNIIGTLDKPTKGRVIVDGRDITRLRERELTEFRLRKIGFVFQFYNLIPVLTALENVELPMIFAGIPKKERKRRAEYLLRLVGLEDRMNHRPDELSGGEQQRVAIARALANNPSIILADEPTGELDTDTSRRVLDVFREVSRAEGVTVIIVTHDPIVAEYADRIIYLRDGKIQGEKILRGE
mgnify:CR=1 FL=1